MKCNLFFSLLLSLNFLSPASPSPASSMPLSTFVTSPDEFGAAGYGSADDSIPISKALAACYDQDLPCRIAFEKHYVSGPIRLERSEITLEVNGELSMLPRRDYCKAEDCTAPSQGSFTGNSLNSNPCWDITTPAGEFNVCMSDIKIIGSGTISSTNPWQWWPCKYLPCRISWRPHLIVMDKIERVTIEGISLKDAPNHNIEIVESGEHMSIIAHLLTPSLTP